MMVNVQDQDHNHQHGPLVCPSLCAQQPIHSQANRKNTAELYNSLQLPRVAQRVLDHELAHLLLAASTGRGLLIVFALGGGGGLGLLGEVDPAVLEGPAAGAGKLDDGALGVEEEERLCGGDWQGGVGALAAGGDLVADLGGEDLFRLRSVG